MPELGDGMDGATLAQLQIIDDLDVHVGGALMMVDGEPVSARTLVLQVFHHSNRGGPESGQVTLFGLNQSSGAGVVGSLLYAFHTAYGLEAMLNLIGQVQMMVEAQDPAAGN